MINRFKIFSKIMLFAMASSLFAVNVTLNVDMSNVTVSEDGVHVAGSFQGWDPAGTPLADDDGDGIYPVLVDMSGVTDETVFFKTEANLPLPPLITIFDNFFFNLFTFFKYFNEYKLIFI